ncbi:hypothetical protein HDV01_006322 [Terramyces sp. JEL0728]|nr:hypothetical protein HDV01_006322 [Terramyces sp. JEL0728]
MLKPEEENEETEYELEEVQIDPIKVENEAIPPFKGEKADLPFEGEDASNPDPKAGIVLVESPGKKALKLIGIVLVAIVSIQAPAIALHSQKDVVTVSSWLAIVASIVQCAIAIIAKFF